MRSPSRRQSGPRTRSWPRRVPAASGSVPRSEMLAALCATRRCLAVSGTHGKTTTASMLSLILVEAGMRPSFLIGADVNEIGTNAVWDTGEWLVVEADESYGTFQAIEPDLAVLTSVEADHLDYYGTFDVLRSAFADFLAGARLGSVVCADDPEAAAIGREHGAITVGSDPASTYAMQRRRAATELGLLHACAARRGSWAPWTSASPVCTTRGTPRSPSSPRSRWALPSRRPRRRSPVSPG